MSWLGIEREGSSSDGFGLGGTYPFTTQRANSSGRVPAPRWASPWWLLFLGLAVAEVVALGVREQRVPSEKDWSAAAEHVRSQMKPTDAITVAPGWADPLLRLYLGDRMDARMSGRSDLADFERLWVLSIRGERAPDAPDRAPDASDAFGRVRVERFDLGPTTVLYELADSLRDARVTRRVSAHGNVVEQTCPWRSAPPPAFQGGLGAGVVAPRERFICDPQHPALWVGITTIEALDLAPRRCIWTHPQGPDPISVTYADAPLGETLVLHGGLDYHDERDQVRGPVHLKVFVDDKEIGSFEHRDGDGMARWEVNLKKTVGDQVPLSGTLRFEISSPGVPDHRSFCWTGTMQSHPRKEGR
ncbi:MAG: hypothetical protein ABW252_11755 [Polyangiales bacterium]